MNWYFLEALENQKPISGYLKTCFLHIFTIKILTWNNIVPTNQESHLVGFSLQDLPHSRYCLEWGPTGNPYVFVVMSFYTSAKRSSTISSWWFQPI